MARYIGSFTVVVVCMVVISFILRSLVPEGTLSKYINFIIGIIVSITIASAFLNMNSLDLESLIQLPEQSSFDAAQAKQLYNEKVIERFKENICLRVRRVIYDKTGKDCECDVMLNIDMEGEILGIDGIYINSNKGLDNEIIKSVVSSELEVEPGIVHIGGGEDD